MTKIKIPQKLCILFNLHKMEYTSRNHALVSLKCTRCGINGADIRYIQKVKK